MQAAARLVILAAAALLGTAHAAADWRLLADTAVGKLSLDAGSMKPAGPQTAFQYRVDFKTPQKNAGTGKTYRSTVTDALVSCKEKTMAMKQLVAYADVDGKGEAVDRVSFATAAPTPIATGSSDEVLWKAVCPGAAPAPASMPPPAAAPAAPAKPKK